MYDDAFPPGSSRAHLVSAVAVGGESAAYSLLIESADVLYYFLAGATLLIRGACGERSRFQRDWVYLRTPEGVFRSPFRSLAELAKRLQDPRLVRVHHGVLLNLRHARAISLGERQIGVVVASARTGARELEWIAISKRGLRPLREHLVLPSRTRRARRKARSPVPGGQFTDRASTLLPPSE